MKRVLLLLGFTAAGLVALVYFAGGLAGPGARRADPEVQVRTPAEEATTRFLSSEDGAIQLDKWEGFSGHAKPEPLAFADAETGESVLVPAFVRWYLVLNRGEAASPTRPGAQRARAEGVELITYREPRTLAEARALARGAPDAREALTKWHVTSRWGEAAFLKTDLGRSASEDRASDPDARIVLGGGVKIRDLEEEMEIESETLEILPYQDKASGDSAVVVRQPGFELTGHGLELHRREHGTHLSIERRAVVRLFGDVVGPDGEPLFDLGKHELRPGRVSADGGAVLDHDHPPEASSERLSIELTERVDVEQEGGRSLYSDQLRLHATRQRTPGANQQTSGPWRLESLDAEGRVLVDYTGRNRRGSTYLIRASGDRLVHRAPPGEVAESVLKGSPAVVTLRGDLPVGGPGSLSAPGTIRATATEEIWLRPVAPVEVPPGADPLKYRRVDMKGRAFLEHRGPGLNPQTDTLEGETMTLLLREREEVAESDLTSPKDPTSPNRRVVAASFAVRGDVRLGGTRMSGMTDRLVGRALDTDEPIVTATGPQTSFVFYDINRKERLLGGEEPRQPTPGPARPAAPPAVLPGAPSGAPAPTGAPEGEGKENWVVQWLLARRDVDVRTQLGGPAVGMPARVEGEEISYDRTPDLARVRGAPNGLARLAVGMDDAHRHRIAARTLTMDRRRGVVEADGAVRGVVFLAESSEVSPERSLFALPEAQPGNAATLGVATNGFIEVRMRVDRDGWRFRPDVEQVVHVEGDLVVELTSDDLVVDTLRSKWLEIGLVRTVEEPTPGSVTAPTTSAAPSPAPTAPTAPSSAPATPQSAPAEAQPTRWDIETSHLAALLGPDGVEAMRARDGVVFSSEEATVSGGSFFYDAARRQMRVRRGPAERARAVFGTEGERNEVRSEELILTMGDDGPVHVRARGGSTAVLLRTDADDPAALERFRVTFTGDAAMTATQVTTNQRFHVLRDRRRTPGPWEFPSRLWADRLVAYGRDLLSRGDSDVQRIVASGRSTTLQTGEGEKETTVWGSRFELDVPTSTATLEGDASRDLFVRRGPRAAPEAESEQTRITIDIDTGEIRDVAQMRLIIRGGGQ